MRRRWILLWVLVALTTGWAQQNVGIGTATPHSSALLELSSTDKGLLVPRLTLTQRNAISAPATGLLIYQTDNNPGFYYYDGTSWVPLLSSSSGSGLFWSLTGNSGTTPWNGTTGNFLGTTDDKKLVIATTNTTTPQPIEFWVGNQATLILNAPGAAAPAWSIQRGGGNTRGQHAVDLQSFRTDPSRVASGDGSVIAGGAENTASGTISVVGGGALNTASGIGSVIAGGAGNLASGDYSAILGGESNTASAENSIVVGGEQDTASGPGSFVGGGFHNVAGGLYSVITGGSNNAATGDYSTIPGGYNLRLGARSFGFSGQTSATQTDLSDSSNIAAFVDVDLWLYNVRNQASQLRLYEPSGSGTNFTAFRAQAQASDIVYTLPASLTPTTTVEVGILQTDASGNLSWVSPSAVVGSNAWLLSGNAIADPSTQFLGTTNNQPLVIRTNGQERVRITENGRVGIGTVPSLGAVLEVQTGNPSGAVEAIFGKGGKGVSLLSNWPTIGFNAYYDYSASQWKSLSSGWTGNISVDQVSGTMRFELPSAAATTAGEAMTHTIRLAITPSGLVGIGTLTPAQALHVEGNAYVSGNVGIGVSSPTHVLQVSGSSALFSSGGDFRILVSKNATGNIASLLFQTNFSGRAELGLLAGSDNFSLRVSPDGSTWTDALTADRTTAFVGIGTTSPSHRLHVAATSDPLRLEGLQTDNTLNQVLVVDANGVVKRRDASTLGAGWSLTGNSGTNPSTNFLGTTDAQPLVIRVGNQETFRFNAPGTTASAWSIHRGGGNTRGLHAVDLQSSRSSATHVASGNYSVIAGGQNNTASGFESFVGGGSQNIASGVRSFVGGGYSNIASGSSSFVGGGQGNTASGDYSAIPGGYNLRVGARSFGFSGQTSVTQTDLSASSNIAAFVDVDMWLYNVRNQASQLRFYEPSDSGTNYTAFRARAQASDIVYTLPASLTPTTTVAAGILQTDGSGNLSWVSPSALVGGSVWLLSGNSGTTPWNGSTGNFLGTTDNRKLVIATTNTGSPQPIELWVGNQPTLILNAPGGSAPAWSIQRGGGNQRGLHAVDLQSSRDDPSQVASGDYSIIVGGRNNTASGVYSFVGGGWQNTASGGYSFVGGGELNTAEDFSVVGGGLGNTASATASVVGGGSGNIASGGYSFVGGGELNTASGEWSFVGGGSNNMASGEHSAIPGGYNLRVGERSFGFSGQTSGTQTNLSAYSNIAAFVDVDMWLYNVRNQASQLRFYEPSGSGTNYTAFRARAQASDIVYTLPASLTPTTTVGAGILQTDASGNLSWVSPSAVGGGNAWSLTGNSGTTPWNGTTGNFLGTTDGNKLVIATTNITTPQPIELWVGNQPMLILNAPGVTAPAWSIHRGGGNTRGRYAVDLQSARLAATRVASGDFSVIAGGQDNTASGLWSVVGGGGSNTASAQYSVVVGGQSNTASGNASFVGGGVSNTASGGAFVGGGVSNTASGSASFVGGGTGNTASGDYSAIPGGYNLRVGARSFGFSGQLTPPQTDLSDSSNIAAFVDVDLWLYNVRNQASQLRLYEPSLSGTNFTAFRAQAQASDIVYTLPASLTPTTTVAAGILQTDGSGNLSWVSPSALGGGNAWSLVGNSGTNPSTNFLGTTDNQPLVIRVWGQETFRFNAPGSSAPAWSIHRGGGDPRGLHAVDLQSYRSLGAQVASGDYSVIVGGLGNTSSATASVVVGGQSNTASGQYSFVGGGYQSTASGLYSFVGGGYQNTASGGSSFVGGGRQNTASGSYSFVGGGQANSASQTSAVVVGGDSNQAQARRSFIGGGGANRIIFTTNAYNADYSFIGGGYNNSIGVAAQNGYWMYSAIVGGLNNAISGANAQKSFIGGGESNTVVSGLSVIGGGQQNSIITGGGQSVIGGGRSNSVSGSSSVIGGGYQNNVSGYYSVIGGGYSNRASGDTSAIVGGWGNLASGRGSFIGGGMADTASGLFSVVAGGQFNVASGSYSVIGGGSNNIAAGNFSAIPGGNRLKVGTRSFGFSGQTSDTQTNLSDSSNIAAFVDVDLWLYNVRNQASQLRLYEPSVAGTNYTALRAQAQASDIVYTLPAAAGSPGQVLSIQSVSGSNVTLQWSNVSGSGVATFVRKTTDETVTSSTTYQDDDHLFYSASADQVFEFEAHMFISGGAGGIKIRVNIPTGATMKLLAEVRGNNAFSYATLTSSTSEVTRASVAGTANYARIRGIITMGSSGGGNVVVQWAQNTGNASTTVEAGSYLKITPIQ